MTEKQFTAKIDALEDVLAFIGDTFAKSDISIKAQTQLAIAAEEIFVNICHYAYPEDAREKPVSIACWIEENPRRMFIRFTDRGVPFDPLTQPDPNISLSLNELKAGGLGIYIVKKHMSDVQYTWKDNHNILTLMLCTA